MRAHGHSWPTVWIYDVPDDLVARHRSPSGQNILQEVLAESLSESPHRAPSADQADFFYIPVPFHWAGKGRDGVAAVLGYLRNAWPYFNASLSGVPNHMLCFTGDMAMDLPQPRASPPLPSEIDASHPERHFVALSLTGNPETGIQPAKDIVLPPTHYLKGGPMSEDRCCHAGAAAPRRPCKRIPLTLSESPWHPRNTSHLLSWAGQASGGGMGRHGGSGPRVRQWLARAQDKRQLPAGAIITDTNSRRHRERNVRELPASILGSTVAGSPRFGYLRPGPAEAAIATFCVAPYGRGNGWEGRSASAIRHGCVPLSIKPPGSVMALEPFVPWARFSVSVSDAQLTPSSLHRRLEQVAHADLRLTILPTYHPTILPSYHPTILPSYHLTI